LDGQFQVNPLDSPRSRRVSRPLNRWRHSWEKHTPLTELSQLHQTASACPNQFSKPFDEQSNVLLLKISAIRNERGELGKAGSCQLNLPIKKTSTIFIINLKF